MRGAKRLFPSSVIARSVATAKRRSNLSLDCFGFPSGNLAMTKGMGKIRDCFGFPSGNLAMTKEEQGVAGDSLTGC
ncbi:MAG: hypothetical protein ACPL7E_01835, partial [bacterium]